MSSSSNRNSDWPWECTCMHIEGDSLDSYSDSDDSIDLLSDSDDSFSEESSNEIQEKDKKKFFISAFNNDIHGCSTIISNTVEITNFRKKYSQLSNKNAENVSSLWGNIIVEDPVSGLQVTLQTLNEQKEPTGKKIKLKKSTTNIKYTPEVIPQKVPDSKKLRNLNIVSNSSEESKPVAVKTSLKTDYKKMPYSSDLERSKAIENTSKVPKEAAIKISSKNDLKKVHTSDNSGKSKNIQGSFKEAIKKDTITAISESEMKAQPEQNTITAKPSNTVNNKPSLDKSNSQVNIQEKNINVKQNKTKSKEPKKTADNIEKKIAGNKNSNNEITPAKTQMEDEKSTKNNRNNLNKISVKTVFKEPTQPLLKSNEVPVRDSSLDSVGNLTKKQLKKQKQREKKLQKSFSSSKSSINEILDFIETSDKSQTDTNNKFGDKSKYTPQKEKIQKKKQVKKVIHVSTDDDESARSSNNEIDEISIDTENPPSFVTEILKHKEKNRNENKSKAVEVPYKTLDVKDNFNDDDDEGEFIVAKRKREKPVSISDNNFKKPVIIPKKNFQNSMSSSHRNSIFHSEIIGDKALDMLLENNLVGGLECLVEATSLNPADSRHYLNRCYCYLRMNKPGLALSEAEYILKTSTNIGHVFIANLRAGQALLSLRNFKKAEMFLHEATRINPENHHARREYLKCQIEHIVSKGFNERDAILALETCPITSEAINYLVKYNIPKNYELNDYLETDDNYEDLIYSSDEGEKPSNVEIINRITNYIPGKTKLNNVISKPSARGFIVTKPNNKDKNAVIKDTKIATGQLMEKAIWVGNLTNQMTEAILKQKFKNFGKITSVYRPSNKPYCFINFERKEDAMKVLSSNTPYEINGIELSVKSAVKSK